MAGSRKNAYGSVPHQLVSFALDLFHVPPSIRSLINGYFDNFHICSTSTDISTGWHRLEKGKAMGCSIFPILFTEAFEIILIGGRQMVRGVRSQSGQQLPAIRSYMDVTLLPPSSKRQHVPPGWYRRLMWPLKLCDITLSAVQKMDSKAYN